jgi:hypothetical protein
VAGIYQGDFRKIVLRTDAASPPLPPTPPHQLPVKPPRWRAPSGSFPARTLNSLGLRGAGAGEKRRRGSGPVRAHAGDFCALVI